MELILLYGFFYQFRLIKIAIIGFIFFWYYANFLLVYRTKGFPTVRIAANYILIDLQH